MAAMVNGTSGIPAPDSPSPSTAMPGSAKQPAKPAVNNGSKNGDLSRKQASSPSDRSQRRSGPPNAWTTGMNPITQRSTNSSQQNGSSQPTKLGQKSTSAQEANSVEKVGHDRLLFALANLMGYTASITTKNGDTFSGIFFGATMETEPAYLLKMVQQTKQGEKSEGLNGVKDTLKDYIGVGEDHSMSFDIKDVVDLAAEGAPLITAQEKQPNGSAAGFRTDTDISGNLALRERQLKRWTPSEDTEVDMSLEGGSNGTWDQFKANEQKFGLKSDYNEEIYTTSLDRTTSKYRENELRAERIAREIEGGASNNAHVREERGLADEDGDDDEESKYSGVRRQVTEYPPLQSSNPNRYMPPARRPPSGQPTVAGAPIDPAIISSQIARPEASSQRPKDGPYSQAGNTAPTAIPGDGPSTDVKQETSKDSVSTKGVAPPKAAAPNATANVEKEVRDSFRAFAEKQKTKVADDRQKRARHDKDIKLNDLKGFSKNFKLNTPVPKDLVPILAKDKKKQDEIMEKARREAEQKPASPPKAPKAADDPRSQGEAKRDALRGLPNNGQPQDYAQYRPQQLPPHRSNKQQHPGQYASQTLPHGNANSGMLSHRLAENQRAHKAGAPVPVPTPLPIPSQKPPSRPGANAAPSQASSTVRTPTSAASKNFNVNAMEFKPNPAANTFQPNGPPVVAASPRANANARSTPRASSPSDFFGNKSPLPASERPSIMEQFNPLKRLKEKAEKEGRSKDFAANGGIPAAYATPVTWSVLKDDEDATSYKDMFNDPPAPSSGVSPQPSTASPMNQNQTHLHQIPGHLNPQGASQVPNTHHAPYPGPPQPHLFPGAVPGGPHQFDDHRMHGSPASNYNAPRMQNGYVAYPSPMGPGGQYPYGQPMPPHMMGPSGPQNPNFRQYPNGPQYMPSPGQQLAAPMMVQQGSQGGYGMGPQGMGVPQMPMYGPGPTNPSYNGPSQPASGYPSPSRGAPMMVHQGSYQGQAPPMHPGGGQYGGAQQPFYAQQPPPHMNTMRGYPSPQPHYSQSPQQHFNYPPPRMPSQGYGHHPPGGPQHAPIQQGPPPGPPMEGGEGMK